MEFVIHFLKGLSLGSIVCFLSFVLDYTVSRQSYEQLIEKQKDLYEESVVAVKNNLLVISPFVYSFVGQNYLTHGYALQYGNILSILGIHSVGYYIVHYSMHKSLYLYKFHQFHHKFDNILLPSIGNAVSMGEYLLAYVTPFILSAKLLEPNEISFVSAIAIISLLNMAIHCKELENVTWSKYLVSPKNHIDHHKYRNKHYAAPTVNLDYFFNGY